MNLCGNVCVLISLITMLKVCIITHLFCDKRRRTIIYFSFSVSREHETECGWGPLKWVESSVFRSSVYGEWPFWK